MSDIWVCKNDGTLQCDSDPGISLADARKELAALIGEGNILAQEKRHLPFINPALCGSPTGNVNACQITEEGALILFRGFVGPMGWMIWTWGDKQPANNEAQVMSDRFVPWPLSMMVATSRDGAGATDSLINAIASWTQVGAQPTTLAELIGRRCRFYKIGDPITMDLIPQRVNFELDANGSIHRIWFG